MVSKPNSYTWYLKQVIGGLPYIEIYFYYYVFETGFQMLEKYNNQ